jgi:hypothetical protein
MAHAKIEMQNQSIRLKAMPGDELMDPHGVTPGQPMYVKDYWKFRGRNLGIPLSGDPAAMEASDARV